MLASVFLVIATIAVFASTASLVFKNEGIRGAGRIVLGIALVFVGLAMVTLAPLAVAAPLVMTGSSFIVCGALTSGFGLRKYLRRNKTS